MKISKTLVNYRPARGGKKCAICQMFRKPNSCTLVAGTIDPDAVCDCFKKSKAR